MRKFQDGLFSHCLRARSLDVHTPLLLLVCADSVNVELLRFILLIWSNICCDNDCQLAHLAACLCRVYVCRLFDSCMDALQLGCLALFAAQLLILLGSLRFSAACLHFSGVSSCKLVHGPLSS